MDNDILARELVKIAGELVAAMAPGMNVCPQCKGRGKLTIEGTEVTDKGARKLPPVTIDCVSCNGKGMVSDRELARRKRERALWCHCGNKSGRTQFYDDGEHPNCSKHCWVCEDCGGIVQVG